MFYSTARVILTHVLSIATCVAQTDKEVAVIYPAASYKMNVTSSIKYYIENILYLQDCNLYRDYDEN